MYPCLSALFEVLIGHVKMKVRSSDDEMRKDHCGLLWQGSFLAKLLSVNRRPAGVLFDQPQVFIQQIEHANSFCAGCMCRLEGLHKVFKLSVPIPLQKHSADGQGCFVAGDTEGQGGVEG